MNYYLPLLAKTEMGAFRPKQGGVDEVENAVSRRIFERMQWRSYRVSGTTFPSPGPRRRSSCTYVVFVCMRRLTEY